MILLNFINIGSQLTHSVQCADELILPVKEEMLVQGMADTLIKVGKGHGVEMSGEKTKVKRISWQPSPLQNMINQKHLENLEYLSNLGSLIMNGAFTCEIKSRISMTKQHSTTRAIWDEI